MLRCCNNRPANFSHINTTLSPKVMLRQKESLECNGNINFRSVNLCQTFKSQMLPKIYFKDNILIPAIPIRGIWGSCNTFQTLILFLNDKWGFHTRECIIQRVSCLVFTLSVLGAHVRKFDNGWVRMGPPCRSTCQENGW